MSRKNKTTEVVVTDPIAYAARWIREHGGFEEAEIVEDATEVRVQKKGDMALIAEVLLDRPRPRQMNGRDPMPVVDRGERERCVEALCEAYPKAFFLVGQMRRPLKKNIAADIGADLRKKPDSELIFYDVKTVVDWYCNHVGYWVNSGVAGAIRLDFNGQPAGKVTEAEAMDARQRAKEIFAVINSKKDRQAINSSASPAPLLPPVLKVPQVDAAMTDDELLASIEKHVGSLRTLASLPNDIQQVSIRAVVLLLIDELRTLDARITKGAGE